MHPNIGFFIGFIEYFFLRYVTGIAEFFGGISWGVVELHFGVRGVYLQLLLFMVIVFAMILLGEKKSENGVQRNDTREKIEYILTNNRTPHSEE